MGIRYLAACTQPKWTNQFGSVDFWWFLHFVLPWVRNLEFENQIETCEISKYFVLNF